MPDKGEEHVVQDTWTFWFEKRDVANRAAWDRGLVKIGAFNSLEGWLKYYSRLARPSTLQKQMSYYLFRGEMKPTWENYPEGGHWTVTLAKTFDLNQFDRLWEQIQFALIGEGFNTPHVIGALLSVKKDCNTLSLWMDNNDKSRFTVCDDLRSFLNFGLNVLVEHKSHAISIKEQSGKGGDAYVIKTPNIRAGDAEMTPPAMDLDKDKDIPVQDRS